MKRTVREYSDLSRMVSGWADGLIGLLIVIGSPGSGKSRIAKNAASGRAIVIEGQMSALGLYEQVYKAKDRPILIDDVDAIYQDPAKVSILKCICQTDQVRRVTWHTSSNYLAKKDIPNEFETSSSICIIGNEWKDLNRNVSAILDRGLAIEFAPTAAALHAEVQRWFDDDEILNYIGGLLRYICNPSMRPYVVSRQLKSLGDDWKEALRETFEIDAEISALVDILSDTSMQTSRAREKAFAERTGASRATFFRRLNALGAANG